jgi:hypothetical protein
VTARQAGRLAINIGLLAWMVWALTPGRTPLDVLLWHSAARSTGYAARQLGRVALSCEARYWKAVTP